MKLFKPIPTTPDQRKERKKDLLLSILSGLLIGISFPPFPFPFLIFFSFIPFLFVLQKKESLSSINRFSYVTIFFFCLVTLYWVGSWTKEADPFLMISGALLIFANPGFYLIATSLYYFSTKIISKEKAIYLFPLYWVFFEYIYGITDLRFPWLTLGNSLAYFNQFIQIADIVGSHGLSLIILYINIFIYKSLAESRINKKNNYKLALPALFLFIIPMVYGELKIASQEPFTKNVNIGLIQPNLNPWEKWSGGNLDQLIDTHIELSEKAIQKGAKLIIWPESAFPVYLLSGNYSFQVERIRQFVNRNKIFLLTGMPDITLYYDLATAPKEAKKFRSGDAAYTSYNSILLFSYTSNEISKYKKNILVPFGEHVPFVESIPLLGDLIKWQVGISSWNVGTEQNVFDLSAIKVGGIICIESIYPEFVSKFVKNGAQVLAVVTNDSWYGNSSGPYQHKEISVLRAIENRRSVVRAANGGISCAIDPYGRILNETQLFTKTSLEVSVPIFSEITFYTRFPLLIPMLTVFISCLTLIWFFILLIKNKIAK